ncbi:unnamed protein product [Acanthoscelides obtectus]|uniref:Uncharacterized protein n=1 Tax=Acanthoscelides obtectus TaxID=200917 RepID=A0A9P0KH41_ACAOB|nr:unnamed protein product [Acanthoscelides obtectus]CAK1664969.1 hypothetical protein AOBTE_LOCUS24586 [Acanthoscelides obtectus]
MEEIEENFTNEAVCKAACGIGRIREKPSQRKLKRLSIICTEPQGNKRRRRNNSSQDHRVAALEVCDYIVNSANDRFQFKDHLVAASLFFPEHFGEYYGTFPDDKLETTCLAYPELEKSRLKTELSVIYARNDYRDLHGTLSLLKFLIQNSL